MKTSCNSECGKRAKYPISCTNKDCQYLKEEVKEIKWIPAILKCKCGEEWNNQFSKVKEGKDLYIETECRTCEADNREKREQQRKSEAKNRRILELEESLPPRYRGKLKDPINEQLLDSSCSIICGDYGSGKTWESYAVARKLLSLGSIRRFELITEVGLLNSLKENFDFMNSKIDHFKSVELLIIDESGKNNDSEFNKSQLFDILNYRYDWEKKTILICNTKKKEDLFNIFPTAILDRFRECIVEMNGKSKRYN